MIARVNMLVKGGVMHKPLWYDAMMAHPPPLQVRGPRPMRLQFDDDNLRRVYLRRNPSATLKPKALFLDPERPEAAHEHEADVFVRQQKVYIRAGHTEEEAYRLALQKQREAAELAERARAPEVEAAQQSAAAAGATAAGAMAGTTQAAGGWEANQPSAVAQMLLRRFAEEARDAGQPYPKHWFADRGMGQWVGIAATQAHMELEGSTQKVLRRTEADVGTVSAILGETSLDSADATDKGEPRADDKEAP